MALRIMTITPNGLAAQAGLLAGDIFECINGVAVLDSVDYQFLCASPTLHIEYQRNGELHSCYMLKSVDAPLGIELDSNLMSCPRECANNCIFCFVAQLPKGMRSSLYIRDDDWRLSLMAGNFITLTNLPEKEIQRIIDRKASPLYLSIHSTEGDVRKRMLRNAHAANILATLQRLADAGISFHAQIVLCPGINDGEHLEKTLTDLYALAPSALSVALVPVGLTKHRHGLEKLAPYAKETAAMLLAQAERWREKAFRAFGTRFVFPADEFYQLAQITPPSYESYEGFPQIENGVGLLRQFEHEFSTAARLDPEEKTRARRLIVATGTSAAPFLRDLIKSQPLQGVEVTICPIQNKFFGETVTVSGLITGTDLIEQLQHMTADELMIPSNMLRAGEPVFLDDVPLSKVESALSMQIRVIPPDGAEFLYALRGLEEI